jgi:hypothetical protein
VLRLDLPLGIVEHDGIAPDDVDRADAQTRRAFAVDEIEIDHLLQRLPQRRRVVEAQRFGRSGLDDEGHAEARPEEAGRTEAAIQLALATLNTALAQPCLGVARVTPEEELISSQKARKRSTRHSGGLPAIWAALIAPIEILVTHSGSRRSAAKAS